MPGLPIAWSHYKRILKWNVKEDDYLGILVELENYEEKLRQAKELESGRAVFVKKGKNQIQKRSKNNKDVSEITYYDCWVKGHYARD